jgi:hypothetical protein
MNFNSLIQEELSRLDRIKLLKSRALDEPEFIFARVQWTGNEELPVNELMRYVNDKELPYAIGNWWRRPHQSEDDKSIYNLIRKYKPSPEKSNYHYKIYYISILLHDTDLLNAIYEKPEAFSQHIMYDATKKHWLSFATLKTLWDIAQEHDLLPPF